MRTTWTKILYFMLFSGFAFIAGSNNMQNCGSDPYGTMLIAQNIAQNHTMDLSARYLNHFRLPSGKLRYQVTNYKGRLQYYFPIGTPLILSPMVAIANHFGYNALDPGANLSGQRPAILVVILLLFLVTWNYIRTFIGSKSISAVISLLIFFGTIVGPTVATGLWSIDIEILLIGITMGMVSEERRSLWVYAVLGAILFLGFLVRPSFAIIIIGVFGLFLARRRYAALALSASVSGILFLGFIMWSFHVYQTYLPPYYLASRLSSATAKEAFLGLLASPSRSVFIFSPILIFIFPLVYRIRDGLFKRDNYDVLVFLSVCFALFTTNVFFSPWTGGWSYGPRILTDMSYIGSLLVFRMSSLYAQKIPTSRTTQWPIILLIIGLAPGLQGIYNPWAQDWNQWPDIGRYGSVVWDWRYPQSLMTHRLLIDKCMTQSKEFKIKHEKCPS